jgi:hypothetical protein
MNQEMLFTAAAKEAIKLWTACAEQRRNHIEYLALREELRAQHAVESKQLRVPSTYPVPLDEFLRLLIPGNKSRRERVYLKYVVAMIENGHLRDLMHRNGTVVMSEDEALRLMPPASQREIDVWMETERQRPAPSEDIYRLRAWAFTEWFKKYLHESRTLRARAGGIALKKKRKGQAPEENLKKDNEGT